MRKINEEIIASGDSPSARFGHTTSLVARNRVCLFGGAAGNPFLITNDTFLLNTATFMWKKLENTGTIPCSRAAHGACVVDHFQMAIFGGATGGGSMAPDTLYMVDLKSEEKAQWTEVNVVGVSPPKRYGHTLTYLKGYLVVFGGNNGNEEIGDVWTLCVDKSPFVWQKIETKASSFAPGPRVYHSGDACPSGSAAGMIVFFGGRTNASETQNNAWGLRRHRNGKWDWVKAPSKDPRLKLPQRHQHSCLFFGCLLLVIGGRGNPDPVKLDIYDTETSEWFSVGVLPTFRHAAWIEEGFLFTYGGFTPTEPNDPNAILLRVDIVLMLENHPSLLKKAQAFLSLSKPSPGTSPGTSPYITPEMSPILEGKSKALNNSAIIQNSPVQPVPVKKSENQVQNVGPSIQFGKVTFVATENQKTKGKMVVRKGSLVKEDSTSLALEFIKTLLQPKTYINYPENSRFPFPPEMIITLCDFAQEIIASQPMVLSPRSPIKIFGDIHGQYSDLMRFFELWGLPCDGETDKDVEYFDYLFLGDYVDRGNHSLETICLLLALKIRYPTQIHLIRGNHEDFCINNTFGFYDECSARLGEDPMEEYSVFKRINVVFDYLPLAAIVDKKVLCIHGGIGSSLKYIDQLNTLKRPLEVVHEVTTEEHQLIVDVLWSDPTDSDQDLGVMPNYIRDPHGTGNIVKFGPDRVKEFLELNKLSLIIRAHECVMDGFERFAGGSLITLFSATDYCGKHKNAGAVLQIQKNLEIVPLLIYPASVSTNNWIDDDEALKKRPPTPPRWKSGAFTQYKN